ncbi:MAG: preprotein translocase subunit SecG [Patescibacteria group bacterium]
MTRTIVLSVLQIASALGLITFILLQHRGTGLGGAFGGSGNIYRSKRGVEQILFRGTIALAVLFVAISLTSVLLRS